MAAAVATAAAEVAEERNQRIDTFTTQHYQDHLPITCDTFILPDFPIDFKDISAPGGGRLKFFAPNWKAMGCSDMVYSVISYGYKIQFDSLPQLTVNAKPFALKLPDNQQVILDRELQEFVVNDVIEPADISTPGFYSPVFLREKPRHSPDDPIKYRIIIDLSILNKSICKKHFKMESTNSIRNILQVGDHFFTTDLTMAYNTIPMHQSSKKYLRFWWKNKPWQFKALPFGLTTAPWIFSLVMSDMAKYLHKHSIVCIFYLDDLLFKNQNFTILLSNQPSILYFIQALGWLINFPKSHLDIVQRGIYVGTDFNLVEGLVYPPLDRWLKLQQKLHFFLNIQTATAHQWSSLLGTITSCQDLTLLGRLKARDLQIHLNKFWKNRQDTKVVIPVTSDIHHSLLWWTEEANVMHGAPLRPPPPTIEIWTDSSRTGFGGHLLDRSTGETREFSGQWSGHRLQLHINCLELLACHLCLLEWQDLVINQSVLAHIDNVCALTYINKCSGPRSPSLHKLCQDLLLWCHGNNIVLRAVHIKGVDNVQSDYLSRKGSIINTEWSLHPSVISMIKSSWIDPPQIDLFATKDNHKFPLYISPMPDPAAMATDALSVNWDNFVAYAYPPQAIIPQVLNKLRRHQCVLYLIAPNWPRMTWFPQILQLLVDYPRRIPLMPKLLKQPKTQIFHSHPSNLNLHVFKLSTHASLQEAFHRSLLKRSAKRTDYLRTNAMNNTGDAIYIGARGNMLIPSLPL